MNKILLSAGVATALFAFNANAMDISQYVSGKFFYSDMSNDVKITEEEGKEKQNANDNVYGGSLAYGIKTGAVRTELELNIRSKAEKKYTEGKNSWKNSLENNSLMLNAYYDIDTGTKFTPYVGAGIGMARLKAKIADSDGVSFSKNKTSFAWQIGAGVSYAMTDNLSLDAGYRYVDSGDVTIKNEDEKYKFESNSHEFLLGLRYSF